MGATAARTSKIRSTYESSARKLGFQCIAGADEAGLQVAVHAIGDRANDLILDIFESVARAGGKRDRLAELFVIARPEIVTEQRSVDGTRKWLIVTAVLGGAFVCVELFEFSRLIADGAGPQRSAFLSAFFTLVSTHGLHVTTGIIWIVTMLVQIRQRGLIEQNRRRLACLSLFWHFLDIVWIGVFTFVYLFGVIR